MVDQPIIPVVVLGDDVPARQLSARLSLKMVNGPPATGFYLAYRDGGLAIYPADDSSGAVQTDFIAGKSRHRRLYGGGKGQQIAKAIGIQANTKPTVLDVTAGLGSDAFVLASLGCQVHLAERHPVVRALLHDGLQRLLHEPTLHALCQRMNLLVGDGLQALQHWALPDAPQVIYLDPMFPHTNKSAQVKKEMALFRQLVGEDNDAGQLLTAAFDVASHRVVVKRPRLAPPLADKKPTYALSGKANRYDIYVKASLAAS